MVGLSLFSGMAISELVFKHIIPNYRTVGYVEWDKYCQDTIRARIRDGVIDETPIFGDIREFNARFASLYAGKVDWLSAGFPCQPFSVSGIQLGEADKRNMWPATEDTISIIRPRYFFLENVPGLLVSGYTQTIFADITKLGYCFEWDVVPAAFVGAHHLRERLWIMAYSQSVNAQSSTGKGRIRGAQTQLGGLFRGKRKTQWQDDTISCKPYFVRNDDGVAYRMDRLKALGNGWVPQVVRRILEVTHRRGG